jgi:hypothetical protein
MKPWEIDWSHQEGKQPQMPDFTKMKPEQLQDIFKVQPEPEKPIVLDAGESREYNPGRLESGMAGFTHGITFGLAPIIQALSEMSPGIQYDKSHVKGKIKEKQDLYKKAKEKHKGFYTAGDIASFFVPVSPAAKTFAGTGKLAFL